MTARSSVSQQSDRSSRQSRPYHVDERPCLATVTDGSYLPGTLVLLESFARANPWFSGPTVLIHDGLPASAQRQLAALAHLDIHHRTVDDRLAARLETLVLRHPHMHGKRRRFFSLEVFNMREYDTVLFVDSDVLCTGSAEGLLTRDGPLVCCPDLVTRDGRVRDATTFLPRAGAAAELDETVLTRCFNAGVMVVRPGRLPSDTFEHLLASLEPRAWDEIRSGHTDQVILNRHFHNRWVPAHSSYNWLVSPSPAQQGPAGRPPSDVVFVHLVGRPKPWERPLPGRGHGARAEACRAWDAAHRRFLRSRLMALDPWPAVRHALHVARRIGSGLRRSLRRVRADHSPVANE